MDPTRHFPGIREDKSPLPRASSYFSDVLIKLLLVSLPVLKLDFTGPNIPMKILCLVLLGSRSYSCVNVLMCMGWTGFKIASAIYGYASFRLCVRHSAKYMKLLDYFNHLVVLRCGLMVDKGDLGDKGDAARWSGR